MSNADEFPDELWLLTVCCCDESRNTVFDLGPFKIPRFGGFGGTGGRTRTFSFAFTITKRNKTNKQFQLQ